MIKKYYKISVLALAVLFCILFIFSNSLKDSVESHKDSDIIVEVVEKVVEKIAPENEFDWNFIVRKSAHLFEFFVLGLFCMLLMLQLKEDRIIDFICSLIAVTVIAMTDEFIQSFVGRTDSLTDVIIDVSGAALGLFLILILDILFVHNRNKSAVAVFGFKK